MSVYFTTGKEKITLEAKPLASGGEGKVFRIKGPATKVGQCAKIYFPQQLTVDRELKIKAISQNAPTQVAGRPFMLCFPTEPLYDSNNKFVGFIMPEAFKGSVQLYQLVTTQISQKLPQKWHQKYDRGTKTGIENRLKLCVNIASAVYTIHQTQSFVLVDFKPQNVLITDEAQISIIDLDSVQLSKNQQVLFAAKVATPEYTPKEGDKLNPANDYIPETWDRFSLAVVFYELLFGIHPYTATAKGQYNDASTISEKISKNLFVHGSKKAYLTTIPDIHKNFDQLPPSLKILFITAFEEGNQIPAKRPGAETWGQQIVTELLKSGVKPAQYKLTSSITSPKPTPNGQPTSSPQPQLVKSQPGPSTTKTGGNGSGSVFFIIVVLIIVGIILAELKKSNQVTDSTTTTTDSSATMMADSATMMVDSASTMSADSAVTFNEYGTGNGKIFLWTRYDGKIQISVDDIEKGKLSYRFYNYHTPLCGEDGTFGIILPAGPHKFTANSGIINWEFYRDIKEGECINTELTVTPDSSSVMSADSAK
jgi:serine/threonine protein kinase